MSIDPHLSINSLPVRKLHSKINLEGFTKCSITDGVVITVKNRTLDSFWLDYNGQGRLAFSINNVPQNKATFGDFKNGGRDRIATLLTIVAPDGIRSHRVVNKIADVVGHVKNLT